MRDCFGLIENDPVGKLAVIKFGMTKDVPTVQAAVKSSVRVMFSSAIIG